MQDAEHNKMCNGMCFCKQHQNRTVVWCMQAANSSLKAALAQQEAHVRELTARKASSASEVSAGAASEQAAEHAQQVWRGLMGVPCASPPHERCGQGC